MESGNAGGSSRFFIVPLTRKEVVGLVFRLTLFSVLTYYGIKWMVKTLDPTRKQKEENEKKAGEILKRLKIDKTVKLSEYELSIAAQLVDPDSIKVSWNSVAGLDEMIQELRETVILPIKMRDRFEKSELIQPPKGVLLHGPPGCGKTLVAKATAKEAGARFINLEVASLTDKWYGESQKLASAVFSLAVKLQPTIIFIDEIDSFLRSRDTHDHEATAMMKAQFMSLWDGLITDNSSVVVVMGATNRPNDVDRAILRRMPSMFLIGLPNPDQRMAILALIMKNESKDDNIDYHLLSRKTEGFCGSDLRELCRNAAVYTIRNQLRHVASAKSEESVADCASGSSQNKKLTRSSKSVDNTEEKLVLRPISMDDFDTALKKIRVSKLEGGIRIDQRLDLD